MTKGKTIIIIGTDTGIGKTIVTGGLAYYFKTLGLKTGIQKWVSTGDSEHRVSSDLLLALYFMEYGSFDIVVQKMIRLIAKYQNLVNRMNPYSFPFPASPDLSASLSGERVDVEKIVNAYDRLRIEFDFLIIEGVGGLLVPLNEKTLLIDVIQLLEIPVVLVSINTLGTINHTLMTVESLKAREMQILGIIMNNACEEKGVIKEGNVTSIKMFSDVEILGTLGDKSDLNVFMKEISGIGEKIKASVKL